LSCIGFLCYHAVRFATMKQHPHASIATG